MGQKNRKTVSLRFNFHIRALPIIRRQFFNTYTTDRYTTDILYIQGSVLESHIFSNIMHFIFVALVTLFPPVHCSMQTFLVISCSRNITFMRHSVYIQWSVYEQNISIHLKHEPPSEISKFSQGDWGSTNALFQSRKYSTSKMTFTYFRQFCRNMTNFHMSKIVEDACSPNLVSLFRVTLSNLY